MTSQPINSHLLNAVNVIKRWRQEQSEALYECCNFFYILAQDDGWVGWKYFPNILLWFTSPPLCRVLTRSGKLKSDPARWLSCLWCTTEWNHVQYALMVRGLNLYLSWARTTSRQLLQTNTRGLLRIWDLGVLMPCRICTKYTVLKWKTNNYLVICAFISNIHIISVLIYDDMCNASGLKCVCVCVWMVFISFEQILNPEQ